MLTIDMAVLDKDSLRKLIEEKSSCFEGQGHEVKRYASYQGHHKRQFSGQRAPKNLKELEWNNFLQGLHAKQA
ncbi:hypothetical protein ACI2KR_08530 [Pseudomonas luteola]